VLPLWVMMVKGGTVVHEKKMMKNWVFEWLVRFCLFRMKQGVWSDGVCGYDDDGWFDC
jgi:hypothetical protein